MKQLKLTYDIVEDGPNRFVGWLNEVEGVVAQGITHEEVRDELLKVLRIKWDTERAQKTSKSKPSTACANTEELLLQVQGEPQRVGIN